MRQAGSLAPRPLARLQAIGKVGFAADATLPRELHMRIVRASAAGALAALDVAAAGACEGVVAVWTAAELPFRGGAPRQPLLAAEAARYAGEPLVAVFAETAAAAEDGAECVTCQIEPAAAGADPARDARGGTRGQTVRKAYGDINRAFHSADEIVDCRVRIARPAAPPFPPSAVLAQWNEARRSLRILAAARAVHDYRDAIAEALALPTGAVEVEAANLGSAGFGREGHAAAEDIIAALAARALGRPVRYVGESGAPAGGGRGLEAHARAAVLKDGRVLGIDAAFWLDGGAEARPPARLTAELFAALLPGPYAIEAFRAIGRVGLTSAPPLPGMRGTGRMEATFVRERLFDAVAHRLGLDPLELRRRNLPSAPPAAPVLDIAGTPLSTGNAQAGRLLDRFVRHFSLDTLAEVSGRPRQGEARGLGIALFEETSGPAPFDHVVVRLDRSGTVEIITGVASSGQAAQTTVAEVVAAVLGCESESIRVDWGRTAKIDEAAVPFLAGGTALAAAAAQMAAERLFAEILNAAAMLLGTEPARLSMRGGRIHQLGRPIGATLDLATIAEACRPGGKLAGRAGGGLVAEGWSRQDAVALGTGATAALVEVDRPTGFVHVKRVFLGYDLGRAINPRIVAEQLTGAALQGISEALFAQAPGGGAPLTMGAPYRAPAAAELPPVEIMIAEEAPSPASPLGMKGVGAAGLVGIGAAIAAALDRALGVPGFAVALPVTPRDVRAELRGGEAKRPG